LTPERRIRRQLVRLHTAQDAVIDAAERLPGRADATLDQHLTAQAVCRRAAQGLQVAIAALTEAVDRCAECHEAGDCACP
jgi:hypothetical protein